MQRQGQPHASVAVSLRAVALLVSWRQKLETVTMDEEDIVVEVIKALSAASGYSTSQSTYYDLKALTKFFYASYASSLRELKCES